MSESEQVALLSSPKARAVSSLRNFIERNGLRAGDRLPAESKLAAQFDVSRMTLRSALDVLEREGMVRRERNLGCFCSVPAKSEDSLMARTVVLLTDHHAANDGQVFGGTSASIVSGVINQVEQHGMHFLRANLDPSGESCVQQLVAARPQGAILSMWRHTDEWQRRVVADLSEHGIPVVVGTDSPLLAKFDRVGSDHAGGTRKLVQLLAGMGQKNILRFWGVAPETPFAQARNQGYETAVHECGLSPMPPVYAPNADGIPIHDIQTESDFRIRVRYLAGYLVEYLRPGSSVDAIMATSDADAFAVLAACRLFGRDDVVVTGYDNRWRSEREYQWEAGRPVATVEKSNHRLGEQMVELLLKRIAGELPEGPQQCLVEQQVVVMS